MVSYYAVMMGEYAIRSWEGGQVSVCAKDVLVIRLARERISAFSQELECGCEFEEGDLRSIKRFQHFLYKHFKHSELYIESVFFRSVETIMLKPICILLNKSN